MYVMLSFVDYSFSSLISDVFSLFVSVLVMYLVVS